MSDLLDDVTVGEGDPIKTDLSQPGMNGSAVAKANGRKKSQDQNNDLVRNYLNSLEDPFPMQDELDRPR